MTKIAFQALMSTKYRWMKPSFECGYGPLELERLTGSSGWPNYQQRFCFLLEVLSCCDVALWFPSPILNARDRVGPSATARSGLRFNGLGMR